jgi:hypothetical protein
MANFGICPKNLTFFQGYVPADNDIPDGAIIWDTNLAYTAYQAIIHHDDN